VEGLETARFSWIDDHYNSFLAKGWCFGPKSIRSWGFDCCLVWIRSVLRSCFGHEQTLPSETAKDVLELHCHTRWRSHVHHLLHSGTGMIASLPRASDIVPPPRRCYVDSTTEVEIEARIADACAVRPLHKQRKKNRISNIHFCNLRDGPASMWMLASLTGFPANRFESQSNTIVWPTFDSISWRQ
jgi:hypothetical protein